MKNRRPPSTLTPLLVPIIALLSIAAGCSARVEIETTATDTDPRGTVEKTAIGIDLFTDRESDPKAEPVTSEKSNVAQESRPAPEPASRKAEGVSAEKSVKVVRNVVNVYEGDLHLHEHLHVHEAPRKSRGKAVEVRIEVGQKPQRDERCSRLLREHLETVRKWEAMLR